LLALGVADMEQRRHHTFRTLAPLYYVSLQSAGGPATLLAPDLALLEWCTGRVPIQPV
jgi:hypothetical protein